MPRLPSATRRRGRVSRESAGAPLQFPTDEDADPPQMKPRLSSSSGPRASRSLMRMSERDARGPQEHEHLFLIGGAPAAKDEYAWTARAPACSTSAVPRRLDRGDVDPPHVHHVATAYSGYGYQFWTLPSQSRRFALLGAFGQAIFVDPQLRLGADHYSGTARPAQLQRWVRAVARNRGTLRHLVTAPVMKCAAVEAKS